MLTVKVCASMSARPTTAAAVPKLVLAPPTDPEIVEWAGQNPVGLNCTASSASHVNVPGGVFGEENPIDRSAAPRLATGPANVTVTGMATPTTSPAAGAILATVGWGGTAATPLPTAPASNIVDTPVTVSTYRSALRKFHPPIRAAC